MLFWPKSSGCCCGEAEGISYVKANIHFYLACLRGNSRPHLTVLTLVDGSPVPINSVVVFRFGGAITGGTVRLTVGGVATANIAWSSNTATLVANIQAAIENLATYNPGDVLVTDGGLVGGHGEVYVESKGARSGTSGLTMSVNNNSLTGTSPTFTGSNGVSPANTVNEIQEFIISGSVTGGTFKLGYDGQTTASITWSATATTLRDNVIAALRALPNIGATAVNGSGTFPTWIRFNGAPLAATDVPQITVEENLLTGDVYLPLVGATVEVFKAGISAGSAVTDADGNVSIALTLFGTGLDIHVTSTQAFDCVHANQTFLDPGTAAILKFPEYYRETPLLFYFEDVVTHAPTAGVGVACSGVPATPTTTTAWADSATSGADGYARMTIPGSDLCNSIGRTFDYTISTPGQPDTNGFYNGALAIACGILDLDVLPPALWPV